jgi:predicted alpha-1,2-mannosidase
MKYYVERGYVPEDIEGEGMHKDGAAMTLEYAYYDWCLAQLALALGNKTDAQWLLQRSANYTNLWDASVKFMRPRRRDGSWLPSFEPVGAKAAKGFCEANAAIYTHYVPQDVPGLARLFGGAGKYTEALNRQFELAAAQKFLAQHGKHELQWVDYDNEPSMAMAHLFNLVGAPWLSQKWVRAVQAQAYGDTTPFGGYNGDEDQGQMGALMAIGLFDVAGGAALHPSYQITSPIFDRVTIHLNRNYSAGRTFRIETRKNSAQNIFIQSARLNGRPLNLCRLEHAELVQGGTLEVELGPEPNKRWGGGEEQALAR